MIGVCGYGGGRPFSAHQTDRQELGESFPDGVGDLNRRHHHVDCRRNFHKRPRVTHMEEMSLPQAVWIGAAQILSAVFPGTSRSMCTIAAGQVAGMSRPAGGAGVFIFPFHANDGGSDGLRSSENGWGPHHHAPADDNLAPAHMGGTRVDRAGDRFSPFSFVSGAGGWLRGFMRWVQARGICAVCDLPNRFWAWALLVLLGRGLA